jgi:hypothetical protein
MVNKQEYGRQYMRRKRLDPEYRAQGVARTKKYRATPHGHKHRVLYKSRVDALKHGWVPIDPATWKPYPDDGCCGLCKKKSKSKIRLHADHDHYTGRMRGWTCYPCNIAAGWTEKVGLNVFAEWVKHEEDFAWAA